MNADALLDQADAILIADAQDLLDNLHISR